MRLRLVVALTVAVILATCTDAPVDPGPAPRPDGPLMAAVAKPIAQAGCAAGLAVDGTTSRVLMLSRADLPFRLPPLERTTSTPDGKRASFRVSRFSVDAGGTPVMIACLVPIRDAYAAEVAKVIGSVPQAGWNELRARIGRDGALKHEELGRAVGSVLRKQTFPNARRFVEGARGRLVAAEPRNAVHVILPGGTLATSSSMQGAPVTLGTVYVTAGWNYAVIDTYSIGKLLSMGEGEPPYSDFLREWYLEQYSRECEEWNRVYNEWYQTKDQVAWAAHESAQEVDALLQQVNQTSSALENAAHGCKRVPGKPLCIDSFISACAVLNPPHPYSPDPITVGVVGDCRTFDSNADWSQSRVQIYVDPVSLQFELKYNNTVFIFGPHLKEFDDSATVCKDGSCVRVDRLDSPPGAFQVTYKLANSVCAHFALACPAIDANVSFYPDPSRPGGYDVRFIRDSYPSFGVYWDGPNGFVKMREDPERARNLYEALLKLLGTFRSTAEYVPPPDNPNGCAVT